MQTIPNEIKFDEKMVFGLLRKMNANKAAGPDGIQSRLIKMCAKGLAKPLTTLFNKCFGTGKYRTSGNWQMSSQFLKRVTNVLLPIIDLYP